MHGDFSRWLPRIPKNQVGILAQEGRVLLDADITAQALLGMRWQDIAARSAFGGGVAAIPADNLDAWKVISAKLTTNSPNQAPVVHVEVMPGLTWADGLLVELDGPATKPVDLVAVPLQPPLQTPPQDLALSGTRDAVILEVWRQALNGFQAPDELIEHALGGPDTAERIQTAFALRLYRLADGDDCRTIIAKLRDDLASRGKLHATLAPLTTSSGDCPVVQGGGYSGFEHDLYRIEIAQSRTPSFKWSQWNGGLVGTGMINQLGTELSLLANREAIRSSGLSSVYIETLEPDPAGGGWRATSGMRATLDADAAVLKLGTDDFGTHPAGNVWTFRVWNELRPLSDFPLGSAVELRDGIRLEFEPQGVYVPGDYWTFPVRAGDIGNPLTLLDHAAPFGIHHHRVPLAELHWDDGEAMGDAIEDCRVPLHPITAQDGCCTHSVGDGITSHGDFTKINDAIAALPQDGGRVCVLPGEYPESVLISGRRKIEIVGCGVRSKIVAPRVGETSASNPAIHVLDSSDVTIRDLQVVSGFGGIGILLEADDAAGASNFDGGQTPFLQNVEVRECEVRGGGAASIEVRGGFDITIRDNRVLPSDQVNEWSAITVQAEGVRIERNYIQVIEAKEEYNALGGIWLRGGCVDIDVVDNEIIGGVAHGVMLGHVEQAGGTGPIYALTYVKGLRPGFIYNKYLPTDCVGCGPGTTVVPPPSSTGPTWVAGDELRTIRIRNNSISGMGMSGVGVFGFFANATQGIITVEDLEITGNEIFANVSRNLAAVGPEMVELSGYGAVSLAHVVNLVVRDNNITGNGTSSNGGVCGIFVLQAEGLELSRNRILDNGPTTPQHITYNTPRGGIWLAAVTPAQRGWLPTRIAGALRENEVRAPNGPALSMGSLGHVQVVANALACADPDPISGFCTVEMTSYGIAPNFQTSVPTLGGLKSGLVTPVKAAMQLMVANKPVPADHVLTAEELGSAKLKINPGAIGILNLPPASSIMFAENHVVLVSATTSIVGSVRIDSIADVQVTGNHFHTTVFGTSWVPVFITGATARIEHNKFTDQVTTMWSMVANASYGVCMGNVADHCLYVVGDHVINQQNWELDGSACGYMKTLPQLSGISTEAQP